MAVWNCEKCGYVKEGRCKPKKCPAHEGGTKVRGEGNLSASATSGSAGAASASTRSGA